MNDTLYGIGIDQAKKNTALTIVEFGKTKPIAQVTIKCDDTIENKQLQLYDLSHNSSNWIFEILYKKIAHRGFWNSLIITREDHSFQQFGAAHANIELAGHFDQMFINGGMRPGENYFTILPRVWMSWAKVKKPKVSTGKGSKLDVPKYISMYPGYGANEHELDSYFIAMYGCMLYSKILKEMKQKELEETSGAVEVVVENENT